MAADWMNYIAMITGIIGTITGIAGTIMGYISYRKSNTLKSLDLRLELRRSVTEIQSNLSHLAGHIEHADRSRKAVAAASGRFHSGMMQKWAQDVESDKAKVEEFFKTIPTPTDKEDYGKLDHQELESKLVEMHQLKLQVDGVIEKYDASIRSDDDERRRIRERTERGIGR